MKPQTASTIGIGCLLFLSACGASNTATLPPSEATPPPPAVFSVSSVPGDIGNIISSTSSTPAPSSSAKQPVIISMTVEGWKFTPNVVTVKRGEQVTIRLTNIKGNHSFFSPELGIDVTVPEGETKDIVIPTSIAGTFEFHCGIPCGPGHPDMTGQVIIQD